MAKKTKYTKRVIIAAVLLTILSFTLCFGPCIYYVGAGLLSGAVVAKKVALTMTIFFSFVMSMICVLRKTAFRSSLWIVCIGLWLCLDSIIPMLIITAICQTTDELIIAPLARHFRNKAHISKEIDKRCQLNP